VKASSSGLPEFHPRTVLRDWGNGEAFHLADALTGVCVFGATGSGKPTIQNRTEIFPTGDKVINEAREAFGEAWQIGLQQSRKSIYPKLPLLDRESMEPEI
jgi:hypothetical protein